MENDPPYDPARPLPPAPQSEVEQRVGCMDVLTATAGMGCALFVRSIILIAALVGAWIFFQSHGGSGDLSRSLDVNGASHRVFRKGVDGWPLMLLYLDYFKKQFGRSIVDELHTRIHIFQ
jgi:hypothetical protein